MTKKTNLALGDFSSLAENYALYRPAYSPFVLDALIGLTGKEPREIKAADVGAGTGIWSRMLAKRGIQVDAVEPNDAMRKEGIRQTGELSISWYKGSGEETTLVDGEYDIVAMASSFHWTRFDEAIREFSRILKPGGLFIALWNTRHYESNPLLADIEDMLRKMLPNLKRVSSGRSEFCEGLYGRLAAQTAFADCIYMEGRHTERQSHEAYIGLWESVNDVRAQAGEAVFADFINAIREKIAQAPYIDAEYLTRAWLARSKKNENLHQTGKEKT